MRKVLKWRRWDSISVASVNVCPWEIYKACCAFANIYAGLGRWINVCVTAYFRSFGVCVLDKCVQIRVSVDGKFENIGTNEYFLSCGFSSLFCFIYCLNCNNIKEKKLFVLFFVSFFYYLEEETTNWRHSYWDMPNLLYQAELDGCFRNT